MTELAMVNNVDHKDLRVITQRGEGYGDAVKSTLAFTFEFRNLQAHYPILLQQDSAGLLQPVVLFGFEEKENLFLDTGAWNGAYIPAMLRREPFLIGRQKTETSHEDNRILSIDLDHPRVSRTEGEALFQPLGGRTPFLEDTANLVEQLFIALSDTRTFVDTLVEQELIENVVFDIQLNDGSQNQLLGYHTIAEHKLQTLSGQILESLSSQGFLMPVFMMLASLANLERLIELKNKQHLAH